MKTVNAEPEDEDKFNRWFEEEWIGGLEKRLYAIYNNKIKKEVVLTAKELYNAINSYPKTPLFKGYSGILVIDDIA